MLQLEKDLLEIDEKLPQMKLDLIEAKRSFCFQSNFNFSLLIEIEKKYEELLRDLKGNGLGNVIYKEKSKALNIMYFVLGTLISLFNYLFKTGAWYIYLIMIMPVVVIILSKREK